MCGWDQSYTVSVEHSFVCSIFFFTFLLKDTEEQRLIFCFCIFFFLLVLEKLNKNFRI